MKLTDEDLQDFREMFESLSDFEKYYSKLKTEQSTSTTKPGKTIRIDLSGNRFKTFKTLQKCAFQMLFKGKTSIPIQKRA